MIPMLRDKQVALVAHDNRSDLIEWAAFNRDLLAHRGGTPQRAMRIGLCEQKDPAHNERGPGVAARASTSSDG